MKTIKKSIAVFFAVLSLISALSVTSFAATKYASYDGKYGKMVPMESDYKTKCKSYSVDGDSGMLYFSLKSKGYNKNVYFGLTIYSDEERQNILINKSGIFPTVNSTASINIDFSTLESGTYYGLTFTYIKKGENLVVDRDSIYQFDIKLNRLGNVSPAIIEADALYSGNFIAWEKVNYADSYRVYRKQSDTSWKKLADVTELKYFDKNVVRGEKYFYTVRAYDNSCGSDYNKDGAEVIYLASPSFSGAPEIVADNGIKVSWNAVDGAEKYRIYRQTSADSKYTLIATVSSDVSEYTDKTEKTDGKTYYYSVKAVAGTTGGILSEKVKIKHFGTKNVTVSCKGTAITVKWDSVKDASEYVLFKKQEGGKWETVFTDNDALKYVDKDVKAGKKYSYSIVVKKGDKYSSFDTKGVSVYCLAEPRLSVSSDVDNSICIKWDAVKGATQYNVYRGSASEKYKLLGKTSKAEFYDIAKKNSNYIYSYYVEAVGNNSVSTSGNNIKSHLFMEAPEMLSVNWDGGNTVKWGRVAGATSYTVYRRTPKGAYKKIAEDLSSLEFIDTTAKKGTAYLYTVSAMNGKIKGSFESGLGINCLGAPKVTKVSVDTSGETVVKWNKVDGATSYRVYRRVDDGKWESLGKTTSLTYTDTSSRVSGKEYSYTVRAYNSKGNGEYSQFGVSCLYLSMPKAELERTKKGAVKIEWKEVKGAKSYRILRKTEKGSWKTIESSIDGLSYTDSTAKKGTTYYYAVRALNGKAMSGYKSNKIS